MILDSNHTHDHVAREHELYAPLVHKDGYLIVLDTVIGACPPAISPIGRLIRETTR
jgi:cephalosporin hydroxylase